MNSLNGSIHHYTPQRKDENELGGGPFCGLEYIVNEAPPAASRPVGSDLTPADYAALEARCIDRGLADRAQLRRVDSLTGGEVVGRKNGNYAGIMNLTEGRILPVLANAIAAFRHAPEWGGVLAFNEFGFGCQCRNKTPALLPILPTAAWAGRR